MKKNNFKIVAVVDQDNITTVGQLAITGNNSKPMKHYPI